MSFLGNLLAAVPSAIFFSWLFLLVFNNLIADKSLSLYLFDELHPIQSPSFIYAALAGMALFVAGLASGYYDNRIRYGEIPRRLAENNFLRKLMGSSRLDKFSTYIGMNLGNISGYIVLGILFGSISTVGYIFGIPLEFRHITFSAANVGMALYGLNFNISLQMLIPVVISLMVIGFLNFFVSFTLALIVAIKSRSITFRQSRNLFKILWYIIKKYPLDLFMVPAQQRPEELEVKKKNKV